MRRRGTRTRRAAAITQLTLHALTRSDRHERHRDSRRHQDVRRAPRRQRPDARRARGSIYGFIGPNGSGKTTTIRMIMNIILPDSRRDHRLRPASTTARPRDEVGYLPEERGLYKQMTGAAGCCGTTASSRARRARELDPVIDAMARPSAAQRRGPTSASISSRRAWRRRSSSSPPSWRSRSC